MNLEINFFDFGKNFESRKNIIFFLFPLNLSMTFLANFPKNDRLEKNYIHIFANFQISLDDRARNLKNNNLAEIHAWSIHIPTNRLFKTVHLLKFMNFFYASKKWLSIVWYSQCIKYIIFIQIFAILKKRKKFSGKSTLN